MVYYCTLSVSKWMVKELPLLSEETIPNLRLFIASSNAVNSGMALIMQVQLMYENLCKFISSH